MSSVNRQDLYKQFSAPFAQSELSQCPCYIPATVLEFPVAPTHESTTTKQLLGGTKRCPLSAGHQSLRQFRILILKATHAPFVAIIFAYESSRLFSSHRSHFPPASTSSMHINSSGQGLPLSGLSGRFTALKPGLAPSTLPRV
jgi:hypothetical protein